MIVSHVPRATLISCMRVSQLHAGAGKVLYRTVRVDERNIWSFFRGALVGTGVSEETECERDGAVSADDEPPAHRNFKAPLLAHTRVLSLGSHHTCPCDLYGPHAARLLRNLDTLRIVPTSVSRRKLEPLCDHEDVCPLFQVLTPRKLVLRNTDGTKWHRCCWPEGQWNADRLQEVVWVLPSYGAVYGYGKLVDQGGERFGTPAVTRVKVIFHDGWEVWPAGQRRRRLPNGASSPVTPEAVIKPLAELCNRTDIHTTVYGLEAIEFHTGDSWLVLAFQELFPHTPLDDDDGFRQLVRDELRTGVLCHFIETMEYDDIGYRNKEEYIEYKTMAEYAALSVHERLYELHDGLVRDSA